MKSFVLVNKSSAGTELIVERARAGKYCIIQHSLLRNAILQQQWKRYIYTFNRWCLVIHPDWFVILVILLSEDELNLLLTVINMRYESFNHLSSAIVAI